MSYILDALRKADADRERGVIPGIHSRSLPASGNPPSARPTSWPLRGAAAAMLLMLSALMVWRFSDRDAPARSPGLDQPAARTPAPVQATQATQAAPVTAAAIPVSSAASSPPAGVIAQKHAEAEPAKRASQTIAARSAGADRVRSNHESTTSRARTQPAEVESAASASTDTRVYAARDLPEDVKRALPALSINGSSYSERAANRLLILNGQVFHEGDQIAPDLRLERINLRSAVLRFKEYRYSVDY